MDEDVEELDQEPPKEEAVTNQKPQKGGMEGGVEGGVAGGDPVHGVLGGVLGGVPGGQLGAGIRTVHHKDVKYKREPYLRYPKAAKDLNLGDITCLVRVWIDESGVPNRVEVEKCPKAFHRETKEAMLKARWFPARFEGEKIPAQFLTRVKYVLN
jgi:hypothetical protein